MFVRRHQWIITIQRSEFYNIDVLFSVSGLHSCDLLWSAFGHVLLTALCWESWSGFARWTNGGTNFIYLFSINRYSVPDDITDTDALRHWETTKHGRPWSVIRPKSSLWICVGHLSGAKQANKRVGKSDQICVHHVNWVNEITGGTEKVKHQRGERENSVA